MKIRIEDWDHLDDLNLDDLEFSERLVKRKTVKTNENPPVKDKYKKGKKNAKPRTNSKDDTE